MCSGTTVHSFGGGGGGGIILECIIVHIKIITPCAVLLYHSSNRPTCEA